MKKRILAALSLLPLYSSTLFAEGTYSVGFGSEYSSGDYGADSTATLWSVPISLNYQADKWGWGISVPYLILRSSGNVVVGSGGMIGTGPGVIGGGGTGGGGGHVDHDNHHYDHRERPWRCHLARIGRDCARG